MNFLSPIFLWLLPVVSIPIIIYLYNRNRYKSLDFSSLKFFNLIESKSLKKFNILNIILLIIRTLIIFFIIIMISRPIYKTQKGYNLTKNTNSIVLIGIDNSFSMHDEIMEKNIKKSLKNIVESFNDDTYFIIKSINNKFELFNGKKSNYNYNNLKLTYNYKTNNFNDFLSNINKKDYSKFLNKYLFILSDLQYNNTIKNIPNSYNEWTVNFIKINKNNENLSISNLFSKNTTTIPNELFQINIEIVNNSQINQQNRSLELFVDNINVGKQIIDVDASSKKIFIFNTSFPRRGIYKCYAKLEDDPIIDDNYFYFLINIEKDLKVDIIDKTNNLFLSEVLGILNNKKQFYQLSKYINVESFIKNLNFADILFIIGYSNITIEFIDYIKNHNKKCRIIIFPDTNDTSFYNIAKLINDKGLENAKKINYQKNKFSELDSEIYSDFGNLFIDNSNRLISINNYLSSKKDNSTLLSLSNSDFILNKYIVDNLDIYLFSIALDLKSSDLPIKGVFIPLINKLISNNKILSFNRSGDFEFFSKNNQNTIIISPSLEKFQYNFSSNNNFKYFYDEIGFYEISKDKKNSLRASNINYNEFDLRYIDKEILNKISNEINFIKEIDDIEKIIKKQTIGYDLWRYFLIIIIFLILIEMYLSNFYLKNE